MMTRKEINQMMKAVKVEAQAIIKESGELHQDDIDNIITEVMKKYKLKYDEAVYYLDFLYNL